MAKIFSKYFGKKEEELCHRQLGQMGGAAGRLGGVGKKVSGQKSGNYKC